MKLLKSFLLITLFASTSFASTTKILDKINYGNSLQYLLENIEPADTVKGTVVASPSRANPDYFYHWVRDAALVMNTVLNVAKQETPEKKAELYGVLYRFVERVQTNQNASGFWNLGEPKYNVDGTVFTGPWGRPQHDGPALRALTLINFANTLIEEGKMDYVVNTLYTPTLPALSVIKQDLEYTARHWNEQGFDYWEEVMGLHFSTILAQRQALLQGANLARRLGDGGAAQYYEEEAKKIEAVVENFWSEDKGYIQSTIYQTRGVWKSQLDISVVLGVLHAGDNNGYYDVKSDRVLRTVSKIENTFKNLYGINTIEGEQLGTAIGRYPEDTYDGYTTDSEGHAWFLATFAMAEFHLKLSHALAQDFNITNTEFYCDLLELKQKECSLEGLTNEATKVAIIKNLRIKAQEFFNRANYHAGTNGHMSEQMNRHSGYMEGATDLTWSYAAHLSAILAQ